MTRIFAYGTLKRGGANHPLLQGQRFLGEARTVPGYALYSLGEYPGMVRASGEGAGVTGEVWEVDESCLRQLDRLEGVSEGLYERVVIPLVPPFDSQRVETYLYLHDIAGRGAIGDTWRIP